MIRKISPSDREEYVEMATEFYSSDAVVHSVPKSNLTGTFDELMHSDRYAEAYIFEVDGKAAGYALLAKTYSQEAGGLVCWIEEIYVRPQYRSRGIGSEFFGYLFANPGKGVRRLRLEVEPDNAAAIELYRRRGFGELGYMQMYTELQSE